MTAYASKEWIFWRLDSLIKYNKDGSISLSGLLVGGLRELFDGDQAPHIEFHGLRCEGGKLIATVAPPEGEDAEEWLASFQDYVGDRFEVEPYLPEKLSVSFHVSTDQSAMEALQAAIRNLRASVMKDLASAIVADFAKKEAAKAGPPYRQFYQQRGSKGKRKRW